MDIFNTIDFDKNGTVDLEELSNDYNFVINHPLESPEEHKRRVSEI